MRFKRCFGCMKELPDPGAVCPQCGYDNTNSPQMQAGYALPCGTLLHGRYVIGKKLGQGGFGLTYIAWDLVLETTVCIKEYFPKGAAMRDSSRSTAVYWDLSENAQYLRLGQESILKEARKAVKLRDLHSVVTIWDVFQENATAYIVMDYIKGMTLNDYLKKKGEPLSETECVKLLCPVMEELEEIHKRGIIHRDISPDNLMVCKDGTLMLLDLGAAKDLSRGTKQTSEIVAKKGFSPSEQYTKDDDIGTWTDVYAMCATIVYCGTGKLLPEPLERMMGKKVDLSSFSPAFASVLEKGLMVKPEDRIPNMGELLTELQAAIAPKPKPKLLPAILCLLAVLLIGAGVFGQSKGWWEKTTTGIIPIQEATPEQAVKTKQTLTTAPIEELESNSTPEPESISEITSIPTPSSKTKESPLPDFTTMPPQNTEIEEASADESEDSLTSEDNVVISGKTDSGLTYDLYKDHVEITGCDNTASELFFPSEIEGRPITKINPNMLIWCESLTEIHTYSDSYAAQFYADDWRLVLDDQSTNSVKDIRVLIAGYAEIEGSLDFQANDCFNLSAQIIPTTLQGLPVEWRSSSPDVLLIKKTGDYSVQISWSETANTPKSCELTISCANFTKTLIVNCLPKK